MDEVFGTCLIFLLLFGCQHPRENRSPADADDFIHIVFDIDWTLVSEVEKSSIPISKSNLVEVDGKFYRIKDWSREMLTELSKRPDVKISFFSGGGRDRNIDLLSKISLMDGSKRSFLDISHKVLSFDDLTEIPVSLRKGERFSDRYKKDLRKLGLKRGKTIIVEDNYRFAINEVQKKHFLWLGPTYNHYERFIDLPLKIISEKESLFIPKTHDQWLLGRNKLAAIWDILATSIENHELHGIPLDEEVQRISKELDLASGELGPALKKKYHSRRQEAQRTWLSKRAGLSRRYMCSPDGELLLSVFDCPFNGAPDLFGVFEIGRSLPFFRLNSFTPITKLHTAGCIAFFKLHGFIQFGKENLKLAGFCLNPCMGDCFEMPSR